MTEGSNEQRAVYTGVVGKKTLEKGNGHVAGNKNKGDSGCCQDIDVRNDEHYHDQHSHMAVGAPDDAKETEGDEDQ